MWHKTIYTALSDFIVHKKDKDKIYFTFSLHGNVSTYASYYESEHDRDEAFDDIDVIQCIEIINEYKASLN